MAKRSVILSVVFGSALLSGSALASSIQDEMVPAQATFMYGVPYGSSKSADGQYQESGTYYNNAPVYTRAGTNGVSTWSLYKRADGKWYVDYNTVSEDWDGTVAYTASAQAFPWSTTAWANSVVSFRTQQVYVNGVPYSQYSSNGDYEISGQIYNGAPVYTRAGTNGVTWSLYKRADGKWYVDFNTVSEDWDGTIAYTTAGSWPWSGTWNTSSELAFVSKTVYLYQTPYANLGSAGEYDFSGSFYNNMPVYQRTVSGGTWSLYRRADGKWYLDGNTIGEDWDGTMTYATSATTWPWDSGWSGTTIAFRQESLTAEGAPYSSVGSAGTYFFTGTIYNNAPVYTRTSSSYSGSIYKRTDGKWYFDFNTVSEDWDGTIAYTTASASWPWSGTWNASGESVCQIIDR